jgi:hypothetical protein
MADVSTIDWNENTKFESVSQLIDRIAARQDLYQEAERGKGECKS